MTPSLHTLMLRPFPRVCRAGVPPPERARPRAQQRGMDDGLGGFISAGTSNTAAPGDGRTPARGETASSGRRRFQSLLSVVLALVFCGLMAQSHVGGAELASAKEHPIKAAFVYNFLKFVEWPASRFPGTNSPIVIGVAGKTAISAALEIVVKGRKINGRDILVKGVETPDQARSAHLLFFPASEDKRLNEFLPPLATAGVLTVGESEAFAREGGMINFVLEGDKCRFDINMDSAEKAGLKVSAQLQKLARTVRRKP